MNCQYVDARGAETQSFLPIKNSLRLCVSAVEILSGVRKIWMYYRLNDMPIYEYQCRACHHQFEAIVRVSDVPRCPACGGQELDRLISQFAVDSGGTRQRSLASIQRQNAKITRDKGHADFEYDKKHRNE